MTRRTTELPETMQPLHPALISPAYTAKTFLWSSLLVILLLSGFLYGQQQYSLFPDNSAAVTPPNLERIQQHNALKTLSLGFEKNTGQAADPAISYITRAPGYTLYLAPNQATLKSPIGDP